MRTKIKRISPEVTLARIFAVLEQELIDATDTEIREAAQELGMNLDMKGSAAFAGLKYPAKARFADYFGPDALTQLRKMAESNRRERDDQHALPPDEQQNDQGEKN